MKHIKLFENFNEPNLKRELKKYGIKNYTINSDGTIDVDGDVDLYVYYNRKLTEIPFKFGKVTGDFNCSDNNLISLDGCPYYVGGDFNGSGNKLTNLNGSPSEVIGYFSCDYNNLTTVEGMPKEIGGDFICQGNEKLKKIDSISNIEGDINCDKNVNTSKFQGYCKKIVYL